MLLQRENYAYTILWESLTLNQRRLLRGLAMDKKQSGMFSARFIEKYGLTSTSSVQRILPALLGKDILDRDVSNGEQRYYILDRFFSIWIRKLESPLSLC